MAEIWDVYDEKRNKTGRKHERGKPLPNGDYHLVIAAWIINRQQDILLTRRHPNKPYAKFWECTGGSVLAGETSMDGALREVKEEIGIDLSGCEGILARQERREHYFLDVWVFQHDVDIDDFVFQDDEVIDAKWVTFSVFNSMFNAGQVVPTLGYFKDLYDELISR